MEAPEYKCPCCARPWQLASAIFFYDEVAYWKGEAIQWTMGRGSVSLRCNEARIFKVLYENIDKPMRRNELERVLYGMHSDGGPSPNAMSTHISRIRRTIIERSLPFRVVSIRRSIYLDYDGAKYVLHRRAE